MKRIGILLALIIGTSVVFASSLNLPWFSEEALSPEFFADSDVTTRVTYVADGTCNVAFPLTCSIKYFSQTGVPLGPANNASLADQNNSFVIPPNASVAFRPVRNDPDTVPGGQESPLAVLVPNRPNTGVNAARATVGQVNDGKDNGSITISWTGDPTDVQGTFVYYQTFIPPAGDARFPTTMSYGHLLPPGR